MTTELVMAILLVATPVMVLLAYRQGTIDGRRTARDEPGASVVRRPKRRVRSNKVNRPGGPREGLLGGAELQRWTQIESNIQAYNGTSQGQKKVK